MEDFNIKEDPYVKLTDFGYATLFRQDQETMHEDVTLGTLYYMAPELLLDQTHDEKVDVWALGCIAAQLLCQGSSIFHGKNNEETIRNILNDNLQDRLISIARANNWSNSALDFI